MLRLELRSVVVPLAVGGENLILEVARQALARIGSIFDFSVQPYLKPAGSFMIRVEANCDGIAAELIDELVATAGGGGWTKSGDHDEIMAIWSAVEGASPPFAADVTWACLQTIPLVALPPSRRVFQS